jgi:phosphoglycolate phosphatase
MRHWFFDLDGTLADTDADIRCAWKATLADLGVDCPDFDDKFVTGPPIGEIARQLFPELYNAEFEKTLRAGFARHYDNDGMALTREYPGMLDEVRRIKAEGSKVYIATNKRMAGTEVIVRKFGWGDVFDGVYAGDMHKDDEIGVLRKPQLLRLIMNERGIRPEECVMVGDTINDFEAAKANGIKSIGVSWGYGTEAELREADIVCRDLPLPAVE